MRKLTALKYAASVLAMGAMAMPAKADARQDKTASAAADKISLEYEKFTLDNGLEVILSVDRSDPIVSLMTVAHVGSAREKPGRTGFAHFFEHMAFNDSENVPQGANRRDIPAWGGARNGYTRRDMTVYYETVPKDAFDKLLWIDSDRLGYMINTVTTAALEREKQVVKNEKRQSIDNSPYGYVGEVISGNLYPADHPYNWQVIGSLPDLQAATLQDVREFYESYYGPNNATLAIVGDIDIAETKAKVERWFGEIKRGPEVAKMSPRPVKLESEKRFKFEDNFARLPELRLVYPTPAEFDRDEVALNALGSYLSSKASPLYREVVEAGLAPNIFAFHRAEELAGEMTILVRANAGTDLEKVRIAIDTALAEIANEGIPEGELLRVKASSETGVYNTLSTVFGKAQTLAIGNEFAGNPARVIETLNQIQALKTSDVERVFKTHIAQKPRVMTSFVPKGQLDLAVAGSELATVWQEKIVEGRAEEEVSQGEAADIVKTPTKYDRSEPPFGELPLSKTVPTWTASLAPNVELIGTSFAETPVVTFMIAFDGGSALDSDGKLGATRLLTSLLEEGSATRSAAEIEEALGQLGATYGISESSDSVYVIGNTLARNLPRVVAILSEILTAPNFSEAALNRARDGQLAAIRSSKGNPTAISSLVFNALVYGDHPEGRSSLGTIETVEALGLDALRSRHAHLGANGVRIQIAGDVTKAAAAKAFAPIAESLARDAAPLSVTAPSPSEISGNVYFIDVPGSKQSVIRAGRLTVPSGTIEHEKIDFANQKFGGSIGGDLAQMLRIEKGYTYGAYSGVGSGRVVQPWSVRTSVRANATGASLDIIRDMVADYGVNFGEAEGKITRNHIIKDMARSQESLGAKLGVIDEIAKYDLSNRLVEERQARLLALSDGELAATARKWFDPDEMIWLVIGDGKTQRDAVRKFADSLPGDFVELDIDGKPLAN